MDYIPAFLHDAKEVYFAAASTADGFISYFPQIFSPPRLSRIVILKGGPGTGKSTLLRRFGEAALAKGKKVQFFLCSAEPSSLDAVLLPGEGIAVIDGTDPHSMDAICPGAVETIFDVGSFWNQEMLREKREILLALIDDKTDSTQRAYRFLHAAGAIAREQAELSCEGLDVEKMHAAALRLYDTALSRAPKGEMELRQLTGFNRDGKIRLSSFVKRAARTVLIDEGNGSGCLFLHEIYLRAKEEGLHCLVSHSLLNPQIEDALLFPEIGVSFVVADRESFLAQFSEPSKFVNMLRFQCRDALRAHRAHLRFCVKCSAMLLDTAAGCFETAALSHEQLENIYKDAMNFEDLKQAWDGVIEKLLSE